MADLTIGQIIAQEPKRYCCGCGRSLAGYDPRRLRCKACNKIYDNAKSKRRYWETHEYSLERQRQYQTQLRQDPAYRAKEAARLRALRARKKREKGRVAESGLLQRS